MLAVIGQIIEKLIFKVEERCGPLGKLFKLAFVCEQIGIEVDSFMMPYFPLYQYYKRLRLGFSECKIDVITAVNAFSNILDENLIKSPKDLKDFYNTLGLIDVYSVCECKETNLVATQYTDLLLELYEDRTLLYPLFIKKCITKDTKYTDKLFQTLKSNELTMAIACGCASQVVNENHNESVAIQWYNQTGNAIFLLCYILEWTDMLNTLNQ